jgi:hypothetical protein
MQRFATELLEETPSGVSSSTAQLLLANVVVDALGLGRLAIIGLLLISPGCGQPT